MRRFESSRPSQTKARLSAVGTSLPRKAAAFSRLSGSFGVCLASKSKGRDTTRDSSLRNREPALLLFHLDLLCDAYGVLCVGLGHGAAVHGLAFQRTHTCAEMEDMRRLGLLGAVFRRDPVDDVLTGGVCRVLRRRGHRGGVRGDLL